MTRIGRSSLAVLTMFYGKGPGGAPVPGGVGIAGTLNEPIVESIDAPSTRRSRGLVPGPGEEPPGVEPELVKLVRDPGIIASPLGDGTTIAASRVGGVGVDMHVDLISPILWTQFALPTGPM